MSAFADATAVTRADDGSFDAVVPPGWDILGNTHGGFLLAICARAMVEAGGQPDPRTITAHYLAPGRAGPRRLDVDEVRRGRSFSTLTATMRADGHPHLEVLGTFGRLDDADDVLLSDGGPPDLPPVEECVAHAVDGAPAFAHRVSMHLHPVDAGFARGEPSGTALIRGWFDLHDGEPIDSIALLCAMDAFPPTVFNARLPTAWTPTIELTVHVRARPAPGPLACSFRTRYIRGGTLEVDGEAWDRDGHLVAQSRQLALVPRAPSAS